DALARHHHCLHTLEELIVSIDARRRCNHDTARAAVDGDHRPRRERARRRAHHEHDHTQHDLAHPALRLARSILPSFGANLCVCRVQQQQRHEDHSRTGRLADVLIGRHEITNKRGGKVTQVIVNMLPPDGKRIDNTYKNYSEKGELTTTTAVYERMP